MTITDIQNLAPDDIAKFAELDSAGFLAGPEESSENYRERVLKLFAALDEFNRDIAENGYTDVLESISLKASDRINGEILHEASEITRRHYDFSINWVPGFFLTEKLGLLWGGCAISFDETQLSVFIIRASFANQKKWLLYRRDELLSHELCHIARMPLADKLYEEFFAYRLSPSGFRRYFGSCFRTQADSIIFILPIFLLLIAQVLITLDIVRLPIYPFWILAAGFPAFLIVKNHILRNIAFRAKNKLADFGIIKPLAVLFRCLAGEIHEISKMKSGSEFLSWAKDKEKSEMRWKIINYKYLREY